MANYEYFEKLDIRTGTIVEVTDFPEAQKPAYKLKIDFGVEIGVKQSSAQITDHYTKGDLHGKQILAVVNFPPRQIGTFMSEVLTLGVPDRDGKGVILVEPEQVTNDGSRLY